MGKEKSNGERAKEEKNVKIRVQRVYKHTHTHTHNQKTKQKNKNKVARGSLEKRPERWESD